MPNLLKSRMNESLMYGSVDQPEWRHSGLSSTTLIASGDIDLCLGGETPPNKSDRRKRKPKEQSLESPSFYGGEDVCDSLISGAYRKYEGMNIQVRTGRKPYVT
jgi:hypothetical protein